MSFYTPFAFVKQEAAAQGLAPLAVSGSFFAYYDIGFTTSYSASNQSTLFDLSGNGNHASSTGTMTYNTTFISSSTVSHSLSTSPSNAFIAPSVTTADFSLVYGGYFGARSGDSYNNMLTSRNGQQGSDSTNGMYFYTDDNNVLFYNDNDGNFSAANSVTLGAWYVIQMSYNSSTNTILTNINGVTGSISRAGADTKTFVINYNFDPAATLRAMSGYIQVIAIYTGSLSQAQMDSNYQGLRGRYGI